ncbi:hypothetical protein [Arthrobacter sp. 31Y]|uniref:hypothetical protein n=1 Tax=Arthrobacter sp. 31Y TaxID=1115632 RepID=UPI000463B45F|nr:hypothetical protein [Arthrobacter sp. 31Y]
MPLTTEGFTEPDNDDRADFAEEALTVYMKRTGSDSDTAIRDLIGDLGHLFDREVKQEAGHDFALEVEWAYGTYMEERHEEANNEPPLSANFSYALAEQ